MQRGCAIFLILICCIFMLSSCSYPETERYDNYLADCDIITRLDVCFAVINRDEQNMFTKSELDALLLDIEFFKTKDAEITQIQTAFYEAANTLLQNFGKDKEHYFNEAVSYYKKAQALLHQLRLENTYDS